MAIIKITIKVFVPDCVVVETVVFTAVVIVALLIVVLLIILIVLDCAMVFRESPVVKLLVCGRSGGGGVGSSDADVVFTAVLFGRVTVTFGVVKSVSLNWVMVYEGTETGAVLFSVLFSVAVATFSIAKTSKAPMRR